jgi:hypothetical protein
MAACLTSRTGIIMYVAPTGDLLDEVYHKLIVVCPKRQDKIYQLYGKHLPVGRVAEGINGILVGTRSRTGTKYALAADGSVLFLTHEGFIAMPAIPRAREIEVLFDESRRCIAQGKLFKFTNQEQQQTLLDTVTLTPMEGATTNTFHKVISSDNAWMQFKRLVKKRKVSFPNAMIASLHRFITMCNNPRVDTYLRIKTTKKAGQSVFNTFEVMLPSKVFDGFKNVVLISAFFEDSQMYYLLKQRGYRLLDITKQLPKYRTRTVELHDRYLRVTLVPLTMQETALSISNQSNLMVDSKTTLIEKLAKVGITSAKEARELQHTYLYQHLYVPDKKTRDAIQLIDDNRDHIVVDPIPWMIRESRKVIKRWSTEYNIPVTGTPLLVLNKGRVKAIAPDIAKRFEVISTSVYGLNKYSDRNVIVFLAAINPTPDLIHLYRVLLPEYQFERDHVADVCVQCVCRVSIRDTSNEGQVLVIVPDRRIANLLAERLNGAPDRPAKFVPDKKMVFIDNYLNLNSMGRDAYDKHRIAKKTLSSKEKQAKWEESQPNHQKIRSINVLLSRLRKQLAVDPKDKTLLAKEASLIARRESLKV